jgi:hypothetical protein
MPVQDSYQWRIVLTIGAISSATFGIRMGWARIIRRWIRGILEVQMQWVVVVIFLLMPEVATRFAAIIVRDQLSK